VTLAGIVGPSTLNMAQTYNQKRNVYSIDQILGHGKDEGKGKVLFLFSFLCFFLLHKCAAS